MANFAEEASQFKVAFGSDLRHLNFTSHNDLQSAFLQFIREKGTFVLQLTQLSNIEKSPTAKYKILFQKPEEHFQTISIKINSSPTHKQLEAVVLT